jgi:hypothetical protein
VVNPPAGPTGPEGGAPTRRGLLRSGAGVVLLAGGGSLLAACGGSSTPSDSGPQHTTASVTTPAPAASAADLGILQHALLLERRTVAAYTAGIPLLDARRATWAKAFLSQELEHCGELIALIHAAGGTAAEPPADPAIGDAHDGDGVLALLHGFEDAQVSGYMNWIPQLSEPAMRAAVASIVASDAQHMAALSEAQGRPAAPSAFPGGAV